MKKWLMVIIVLTLFGCASRVSLETEEPIKFDVSLRVDVYQHVVEEVGSIEDQIYGNDEKQFNSLFGFQEAYAADYSGDFIAAVERRKQRAGKVEEYFRKGYIGEDKDAYLKIVDYDLPFKIRTIVRDTIQDENADREIVYNSVNGKNKIDISEVRKVFFQDHYKRAPRGYWFEIYDEDKGTYVWRRK